MLNTKQQEFVDYAVKKFGTNELSVAQLKDANKHFGCKYAPQWLIKNADYKIGKSMFKLHTESGMVSTSNSKGETEKVLTTKAPETETVSEAAYVVSSLTGDIVPKKDPVFVAFGNYPDVKSIIKSKMFLFKNGSPPSNLNLLTFKTPAKALISLSYDLRIFSDSFICLSYSFISFLLLLS